MEIRQISSPGRTDFLIRDLGGLKDCVAKEKERHPGARYGDETIFARLSKQVKATIAADDRDLTVGFAWEDTNVDPPKAEVRSFSKPIEFVSSAGLQRKERAQEKFELEAQLDQCENVAKTSRGDEERELDALSAINTLIRHGRVDDTEAAELRKSINEDRLKRLREQLVKAKLEDYETLDRELSFLSGRFDSSDLHNQDSLAQLRLDLSEKMSRLAVGSVEVNEHALFVAQEIADSSKISKTKRDSASGKVQIMKGNLVTAQIASSTLAQAAFTPVANNPAMMQQVLASQPEFMRYVQDLQQDAFNACKAASKSRGRDFKAIHECQVAQQVLSTEPRRVLDSAGREVLRSLTAATAAPQQPQSPQLQPPQAVQTQTPFPPFPNGAPAGSIAPRPPVLNPIQPVILPR